MVNFFGQTVSLNLNIIKNVVEKNSKKPQKLTLDIFFLLNFMQGVMQFPKLRNIPTL